MVLLLNFYLQFYHRWNPFSIYFYLKLYWLINIKIENIKSESYYFTVHSSWKACQNLSFFSFIRILFFKLNSLHLSTFPCCNLHISSHCSSKVYVFKLININDLLFQFSSLMKSFEDDRVKLGYFFFTSRYSLLHCHKRLNNKWKLGVYFIKYSLNLSRQNIVFLCWSSLIYLLI